MTELFNITPHQRGKGFTFNLSTGQIDVPDQEGCYVISTGCGSGKTECCKSLIRQKFNEGIVYCTDSKCGVADMYHWICDNSSNIGISVSDVAILTSDDDYEDQLNHYKDNPEMLMSKKVILLTHYRFWTDLLNYFIIFNPQ